MDEDYVSKSIDVKIIYIEEDLFLYGLYGWLLCSMIIMKWRLV